MIDELVILGAGGFGREASLLVEEINLVEPDHKKLKLLGYIDDNRDLWSKKYRGYPILGSWDALSDLPVEVKVICVIGDPEIKRNVAEKTVEMGRKFINLIHPQVNLTDDVVTGKGILINKGCLLTTTIRVGDHVSINPGCGIGHDAEIGDYSTLMWRVNISGNVTVGEGCLIGTGATVLQGVKIGAWSRIGAGAVVTKDLPDGCTAVGVPARIVKEAHSPQPSSSRGEGD